MKHRYNWQSFVLALLLAIALPAVLLTLRIGVLQRNTAMELDPVILGAALVLGTGGFWCVRKIQQVPLGTAIVWLLWFLLPAAAHGSSLSINFSPSFPPFSMTAAISAVLLLVASLWGLLSVPAAAEFLTNVSFRRRANV